MKMMSRTRHSERGTAMAEFAFASFLALSVMFGILEFGRALFDYHLVANAARIGSRFAIVHGTSCSLAVVCPTTSAKIQTYVRSVSPGIDTTKLSVTSVWPTAAMTNCYNSPYEGPGCVVTVKAQYTFNFAALPFANIDISSTSQMVISQ